MKARDNSNATSKTHPRPGLAKGGPVQRGCEAADPEVWKMGTTSRVDMQDLGETSPHLLV